MKYNRIIIFSILFLIVFSGCRKLSDNPQPQGEMGMTDLVIPAGFNWDAYTDAKFDISVTHETTSAMSRISIFRGDPGNGGVKLASGSAGTDMDFTTTVRLPASLGEVFLQCEFPTGAVETKSVMVAKNISYTFNGDSNQGLISGFKGSNEIGPECDDCDLEISGNGSYNIGNGQTVCVTEEFTGSITFQSWNGGGTLQVCGTADISNLQMTEDAHIIVTQDGSLTIGNFSAWGTRGTITVYENATLTINSGFQTQGESVEIQGTLNVNGNLVIQNLSANTFTNTGVIIVDGNVQLNTGPVFYNYGLIEATGNSFMLNNNSEFENTGSVYVNSPTLSNHLQINSGSDVTNNGSIDVQGDISINSGSSIVNNCGMMCTGTLAVNTGDFINNSGFLKGAENVILNHSNNIELRDGSMLSTVNLTMNSGGVLGSGSLNSILVTGTFTIHSNNTVSGPVESATDDLQISNGGIPDHFINGATVVGLDEITNYIQPGGCNPDGIGSPDFIDSDGDGVPDDSDDYPEDFYRAYNNYFPEEDGQATIMFEDLWPSTGDYDFNDLVMGVYGTEVTNAANQVVEIDINFDVKAVGGSFKNGFGWQFANIAPSQIQQVTGAVLLPSGESTIINNANGTEQGQDSAVIIAIENIEDVLNRAGGSMFNTVENGNVGTSDLVQINILFGETTPVSQDLIGPSAYNLFMIKNQERDVEIHLPDRQPTNLMNTGLLGTGNDISDPATDTYYKTATGLPWAILIIEEIDYPIEKIPIVEAFPDFANWAQSGGTTNQNWYMNPEPAKIWTP